MLPRREMGKDHWIFTNQCVAKLTEIEFKKGGKIRAFWLWDLPFTPDHAVPINQLNGGFVLHGLLRCVQLSNSSIRIAQSKKVGKHC